MRAPRRALASAVAAGLLLAGCFAPDDRRGAEGDGAANATDGAGDAGALGVNSTVRLPHHDWAKVESVAAMLGEAGAVLETRAAEIGAAGGEVALGRARFVVPAGALAEPANFTLVAASVPALAFDSADGALGGLSPLSNRSYAVAADRPVNLTVPARFVVPFDAGGADPARLTLASVTSGYLVPQGRPDEVNLSAGTVTLAIAGDALLHAPAGASAAFASLGEVALLLSVGVAGLSLLFLPTLVTEDLLRDYDSLATPHFSLRWRREHGMDAAIAQRVGLDLERAHREMVTRLGWGLPNLVDLDGRYTVYFDVFSRHNYLLFVNATSHEGVTLPGSSLFKGASYVNLRRGDASTWSTTAVHEYVHGLQYGITTKVTPNFFENVLNPNNRWLFEATAAALAGDILFGAIDRPARSPDPTHHQASLAALWDPDANEPTDRLQDFFIRAERLLGHRAFYRASFENLGHGLGSSMEPSVEAVDRALRDDPASFGGIGEAYSDFAYDLIFGEPGAYGMRAVDRAPAVPARACTGVDLRRTTLPPLSFAVIPVRVPAIPVDAAGEIPVGQDRDLRLFVQFLDDPRPLDVYARLPDGSLREARHTTSDWEVTIPDVRGRETVWVELAVVNPNPGREDEVEVEIGACVPRLDGGAPAGWRLVGVRYPEGRAGRGNDCFRIASDACGNSFTWGVSPTRMTGSTTKYEPSGAVAGTWSSSVVLEGVPTFIPESDPTFRVTLNGSLVAGRLPPDFLAAADYRISRQKVDLVGEPGTDDTLQLTSAEAAATRVVTMRVTAGSEAAPAIHVRLITVSSGFPSVVFQYTPLT